MTGDLAAGRLIERGLGPGERQGKRALFDLVLAAYRERVGATPAHLWWVPGRLEVFGKHTDYAGGRSLVCAVPRGLAVAAAPRPDGQVHIIDVRRGDSVTLSPDDDAVFSGWRHYVEVVARRLARNFPGAPRGATIVFASDLPRASGMSSSSALVVALAAALGRIGGIDTRPEWQANIRGRLDAAGYYACLENGLSFGTLHGDAGVGTHGGSEDHAAIVAGESGHLTEYAFVPLRHLDTVRLPDEWRFVLAPSGIASEKTGSAQQSYNRLADGVRVLLDLWNSNALPASSLAAALASDAAAVARLRELIRRSNIAGWPPPILENRLDHFLREDARVAEAIDAFRRRDARRLSHLAGDSQADAEMLLGNQVPETISLARRAADLGASGACSFGAGFGGSVWALVERDRAAAFAERWSAAAFVAMPAPSLTEL